MPETATKLTEQEIELSSLFAEVDLPEAISEKNRELGVDQLRLSREDTWENAGYLTAIAALGNQSVLELLGRRLEAGEDSRHRAPPEFGAVKRSLDEVLAGCRERVDRDNFPHKYGEMLIKYSELMAACSIYVSARTGKKHFFSGARDAERMRLAQVEKIGEVAGREFTIIRARGAKMALSASGVTWWELFTGQAGEQDVAETMKAKKAEQERQEEEEERRKFALAGLDYDEEMAKRRARETAARQARGTEETKPEPEEKPEESTGGSREDELRSELARLRARMDAPKLRIMTQDERIAWQHGSFTSPPGVMTPARFDELLPKSAFMSEDMPNEVAENVRKLLASLNHVPPGGDKAAPPSKRVARKALNELAPYRGEYELIELICAQCEAVVAYEPPKPEQREGGREETGEAPDTATENPFLTSGRDLNCSLEHLNRMISSQSRGDKKLDRVFVRQLFELFREYGRIQADVRDPNRHTLMGILEKKLHDETGNHLDNPVMRQIHEAVEIVRREAAERLKVPDYTKAIEEDTDALMKPENLLLWCSGATQSEGFTADVLSEMAVELNKLHEARAKIDWVRSELEGPLAKLKALTASFRDVSPAIAKLSRQCSELETLVMDQSRYPQEVRRQAKLKQEREAELAIERARELDSKLMPVARLRGALVKELNTGVINPAKLNEICSSLDNLRTILQGESPSKGAVAAAARAVATLAYGYEDIGVVSVLMGQCEAIACEMDPLSRETADLSLHMQRLRNRRERSREPELPPSDLFRESEEGK